MTKSSHRVKAQNANANSTSVVNQSQSGQHVNTIPYSTFQKIKGTEKLYQESIEASSSFNKRLLNDRKMRIPFLDNQTRVAQSNNCMLWLMEYHRQPHHMSDSNEGRPYSYPTKKWYKQRRLEIAHISLRPHHFQHHHHPNYINYYNQLQQMREQHHHHHHSHHNHHHHGHHLNQSASVDANLNYLANSTSNASASSAAAQSAQPTQQSTVVAMNENSNSMDVPERSQQSAANGPQEAATTAPITAGSIGRSHSNDYEMQSSSNQEWANHHHHPAVSRASATPTTSAAMGYIDDSFENFDSFNEPDGDSDQDDYEESGKKKKKKVTKPRRKATDASLNGEEKQFVCDICGVKYKTKPGLTYHRKTHLKNKANGNGTPSQSGTPSGAASSNSWAHHLAKSNDGLLNPDESNTNSMFESHGCDDVNSSSNMSHTNSSAVAAVVANHDKQSAESLATKCGICMGNENEGRANLANPQAPNEKFISCSDCSKLFHPSCLNFFNPSMIAAIKKYNWQCIECKRCTHCGNSENDDKLLFCDDCDRGFHMYCLKPSLNEAPQGDWRCELCVKQLGSA